MKPFACAFVFLHQHVVSLKRPPFLMLKTCLPSLVCSWTITTIRPLFKLSPSVSCFVVLSLSLSFLLSLCLCSFSVVLSSDDEKGDEDDNVTSLRSSSLSHSEPVGVGIPLTNVLIERHVEGRQSTQNDCLISAATVVSQWQGCSARGKCF